MNCFHFIEVWHKYDGFIYPEPSSWSKYTTKWIFSDRPFQKRRHFVEEFFPKWSGFYVNTSSDLGIQPLEALQQVQRLVKDISHVWTVDTTKIPRCLSVEHKLKISEVRITTNQQTIQLKKTFRSFNQMVW